MNSLLLSIVLLGAVLSSSAGVLKIQNKIRVPEAIDDGGKYLLGWEVVNGNIIFEIQVESLAFIGLGVSPSGTMVQADIFIGGVFPNGTSYAGDYYSNRNGNPTLDEQQDWELLEASEDETHTYLRVSRPILVTDPNDNEIIDGENYVIWTYGFTDVIEYHDRTQRGSKPLDLLA